MLHTPNRNHFLLECWYSCSGLTSSCATLMHLLWHQHAYLAGFEFWSSDKNLWSSDTVQTDVNYLLILSFGPVTNISVQWHQTDRRTESDTYEPTVHKHRCAQKLQYHPYPTLDFASLKGMDGLGFLEKFAVSSIVPYIPSSDLSNLFFVRVWIFFWGTIYTYRRSWIFLW